MNGGSDQAQQCDMTMEVENRINVPATMAARNDRVMDCMIPMEKRIVAAKHAADIHLVAVSAAHPAMENTEISKGYNGGNHSRGKAIPFELNVMTNSRPAAKLFPASI